jgi:hypothetical protein
MRGGLSPTIASVPEKRDAERAARRIAVETWLNGRRRKLIGEFIEVETAAKMPPNIEAIRVRGLTTLVAFADELMRQAAAINIMPPATAALA